MTYLFKKWVMAISKITKLSEYFKVYQKFSLEGVSPLAIRHRWHGNAHPLGF